MDVFELLQADIEKWLSANGYDVDLESLDEEEVAEFWANLPEAHYEDLAEYVQAATLMRRYEAGEITQADRPLVPSDPMDQLTDVLIEGVQYLPALRTGLLSSWVIRAASRVAPGLPGAGPAAGWLINAISRAKPITAPTATAASRIRPSGMGRIDDIAALGQRIASGAQRGTVTGVLGRTTAGAGRAAGGSVSSVVTPALTGFTKFGLGTGVVGAAMEGSDRVRGFFENGDEKSSTDGEKEEWTSSYAEFGQEEGIVASLTKNNAQLLKQIYYEDLSETEAFDKMTNYVAGTGTLLTATGASLGQALMNQPDVFGDASQVIDLSTDDGKTMMKNYLESKWQSIPEIADKVGNIELGSEGASLTAILRSDGGQGELVGNVIDDFITELAQRSATMLITPEEPGKPSAMIGIITSYDGSPFGEIVSLNDLTSGGKVGWQNAAPLLNAASTEQITLWQQQLYAWGFLAKPPEVWGRITVDATGDIPTLSAFHNWQINVFNEGVGMVRDSAKKGDNKSLSELITPDGTPRADRVMDRVIAQRMAGNDTRATRAGAMRQEVLDETQDRISTYLASTGRSLPIGSRIQIEEGIDKVLSGMAPQRLEEAFGQGGSPYERALAENILKEFYGTDDWGAALTFGNKNRDEDFFNYASRAGAVSNRERDLLRIGGIDRDRYRSHWRGEFYDELKDVEKDVAVSTLLKFISDSLGTGDFNNVTPSNIADGVTSYAHTIGHRRGLDVPTSYQGYIQQAHNALLQSEKVKYQRDDALLSDVATGSVDAMGLKGGVAGYRYRGLVDTLNRVGGQAGHLRSQNV